MKWYFRRSWRQDTEAITQRTLFLFSWFSTILYVRRGIVRTRACGLLEREQIPPLFGEPKPTNLLVALIVLVRWELLRVAGEWAWQLSIAWYVDGPYVGTAHTSSGRVSLETWTS